MIDLFEGRMAMVTLWLLYMVTLTMMTSVTLTVMTCAKSKSIKDAKTIH